MKKGILFCMLLINFNTVEAGWKQVNVGTNEHLLGIHILALDNVFVCGNGGFITNYNGNEWLQMTTGVDVDINDIFMINATEGWAVGEQGTILHYENSQWTPMEGINNQYNLEALHAFTQNNVYFIGYSITEGATILHWDGSEITEVYHANSNIVDMDASSPDDIWVVGDNNFKLHYDGNQWKNDNTQLDEDTKIFAVDIDENGNANLLGMRLPKWDKALIYQYSDGDWIKIYDDYEPWLLDLDQCETVGFAVGKDGRLINNTIFGWKRFGNITSNQYNEIEFFNMSTGYAVGDKGTVIVYREPAVNLVCENSLLTEGDNFILDFTLYNPTENPITLDVFNLLEAYGYFYFWPSWTESVEFSAMDVNAESEKVTSLFEFEWPAGAGNGSVTFWSAILDGADLIGYDTEAVSWE